MFIIKIKSKVINKKKTLSPTVWIFRNSQHFFLKFFPTGVFFLIFYDKWLANCFVKLLIRSLFCLKLLTVWDFSQKHTTFLYLFVIWESFKFYEFSFLLSPLLCHSLLWFPSEFLLYSHTLFYSLWVFFSFFRSLYLSLFWSLGNSFAIGAFDFEKFPNVECLSWLLTITTFYAFFWRCTHKWTQIG